MRRHCRLLWIAALSSAGCGKDGSGVETGTEDVETRCGGLGAPSVALGSGGLRGFEAWQDGDTVQISDNGAGTYGFAVELLTEGIDTTAPVITLLRFRVGEDTTTEDVGASLSLQCPEEGPGWTGVFAPLDEALGADPAALDGVSLVLTAIVTDQADETTQTERTLVIAAP